jgi:predicted phosphodiesterase
MQDTIWPPLRIFRILRAWREEPVRAADLAKRHRPAAKFIVSGHTHRPGIRRLPSGLTLINTGSFCPPLGGLCVDISADVLIVRRVEMRKGELHPGERLAEFPLRS